MSDSFGIVISREAAQLFLGTPEVRRRFKHFMRSKLSEFLRVFGVYFSQGLGVDTLRLRFQSKAAVVVLRVYVHGLCRFSETHALNFKVVAILYCQWFLNDIRNQEFSMSRRSAICSQLLRDIQTCD